MYAYAQDITEQDKVDAIFAENEIEQVDFIQSDMAPNTIGDKETDAIRSIGLLEQTLRVYDKYLKPDGKFCTKIFMGPGFDEYVANLKKKIWMKKYQSF